LELFHITLGTPHKKFTRIRDILMEILNKIQNSLRNYPWGTRITGVATVSLLGLFTVRDKLSSVSRSDALVMTTFTAAFLFSYKGRTFWLLMGTALGADLVLHLTGAK
jgi:hypothetical protein